MMDSKPSSTMTAKQPAEDEGKDSRSDSDSADNEAGAADAGPDDETSRLRREKRLAMNRESARARRKRKKILIDTLEHQVAELTKSNHNYRLQVASLEKELVVAKQTIQVLASSSNAGAQAQQLSLGGGLLSGTQGQIVQALGGRQTTDQDPSETLRRVLQAQNQPLGLSPPASNPARAELPAVGRLGAGLGLSSSQPSGTAGTSVDPLALAPPLEGVAARLGVSAASPLEGAAAARFGVPPAATGVDPLSAPLEGVAAAARFGVSAGAQNAFAGRPSSVDETLARERLLLLQQQQQQAALANATAPGPNESAARALLLQQIMQEQELAAQNRQTGARGA